MVRYLWPSLKTDASGEEVSMEVTEVKVFPVDEDRLRAYVTITLDHCFVIRDLKVIKGTTGYFVSMPSKKRKDGTYKDIAHPINSETRRLLEERVIQEYEQTTQNAGIGDSPHVSTT
jgi:stage V sporulation protein G